MGFIAAVAFATILADGLWTTDRWSVSRNELTLLRVFEVEHWTNERGL